MTQNQQSPTYLCHSWNSELTLYTNKHKNYLELLIIWFNLGCPTITGHTPPHLVNSWECQDNKTPHDRHVCCVPLSINDAEMVIVILSGSIWWLPLCIIALKVGFHYPSSRPELTGVKKCTRVLGPSTRVVETDLNIGSRLTAASSRVL